jgi:hypothetical protein
VDRLTFLDRTKHLGGNTLVGKPIGATVDASVDRNEILIIGVCELSARELITVKKEFDAG